MGSLSDLYILKKFLGESVIVHCCCTTVALVCLARMSAFRALPMLLRRPEASSVSDNVASERDNLSVSPRHR